MEQALARIFFFCLLIFFTIWIKILLDTNLQKQFKQGKIFSVYMCYFLISFALSTICSLGITKLVESIYKMI